MLLRRGKLAGVCHPVQVWFSSADLAPLFEARRTAANRPCTERRRER